MDIDKYIARLPGGKLSDAKKTILDLLWGDGADFPSPWVTSKKLLAATGQKYFDRRARELRDHCGCDIEIGHENGEVVYRLRSRTLGMINPRAYLTVPQKKLVFERDKNVCQVCGVHAEAGARGLQADHKVPLSRGGSNDLSNWQSLCNECNVAKRGVCRGCSDDCISCVWAFPEKVGTVLAVAIPHDLYQKARNANLSQKELQNIVAEAMAKYLV